MIPGCQDTRLSQIEARLSPDRHTLYFASRRLAHVARENPPCDWDNGQANSWEIPLRPTLWNASAARVRLAGRGHLELRICESDAFGTVSVLKNAKLGFSEGHKWHIRISARRGLRGLKLQPHARGVSGMRNCWGLSLLPHNGNGARLPLRQIDALRELCTRICSSCRR